MTTYERYFTDVSIAYTLVSMRTKEAMKRHKAVFNQKYFHGQRQPEEAVPSEVGKYLPPRRQWKRLNASQRQGHPTLDAQRIGLTQHVLGMIRDGTYLETEWGRRLLGLCEEVRMRVDNYNHISFSPPKIATLDKQRTEKTTSAMYVTHTVSYRAIAYYTNLVDRLIIGLTAKYLAQEMDELLSPSLYSFRKNRLTTHNAAIHNLNDYRLSAGEKQIYAAETDIRKFFDGVNHNVVRRAFCAMAETYAKRKGREIDVRAWSVVNAYLDSYTFRDNVLGSDNPIIQERLKVIDRIDDQTLQQMYGNTWKDERIGIPQGGALSTVLANIVLDIADRTVTEPEDPELFYARFCDDMVILHTDPDACQAALNRYCGVVRQLNLPIHAPQSFTSPKRFFECKSKTPYKWGGRPPEGSAWISFLGYHLHRDGAVRLRKETIERHIRKLEQEFEELNHRFDRMGSACLKQTPQKVICGVASRIVAMGTGIHTFRVAHPNTRQLSWFDFFTELDMNPFSVGQMKLLDRYRTRQFLKLGKRLNQPVKSRGLSLGCPFSYYGALTKRWTTRIIHGSEDARAQGSYGRDY